MSQETCPNCGAELPRRAKACPETAGTEHLGLPEEEFDYQKFADREFGAKSPKPSGIHWFWWLVGLLLLAAMILFLVL